ncbi:hypothetical protein QBC40DRAFT_289626 [Triangularia verruculosa]|uniref:Uncharacterized protein n=1 Tax=Triangularia verruculosa TaxID=2587418 RepID=A0AAN6X7Y5_9PEZI|nr:hypothetical protein QBC40DRAFT_289626 [Triangularia verruculosa]
MRRVRLWGLDCLAILATFQLVVSFLEEQHGKRYKEHHTDGDSPQVCCLVALPGCVLLSSGLFHAAFQDNLSDMNMDIATGTSVPRHVDLMYACSTIV